MAAVRDLEATMMTTTLLLLLLLRSGGGRNRGYANPPLYCRPQVKNSPEIQFIIQHRLTKNVPNIFLNNNPEFLRMQKSQWSMVSISL